MVYLATLAVQTPAAPQATNPMGSLLIGIFWVVMILPQRKQQKKRNEMLNALKKGDKVITVGGIHGEVIELDDEDIRLRIADKVEVRMAKSAVSRVKGE